MSIINNILIVFIINIGFDAFTSNFFISIDNTVPKRHVCNQKLNTIHMEV